MYSVLSEITRLRGGQKPIIDYRNSNHYRIVTLEENGFRTAYCFGVPIYNRKTRKLVEMRFHESNGIGKAYGSNAEITAEDSIVLKNGDGDCKIDLSGKPRLGKGAGVQYGMAEIFSTLNGVAVRAPCIADQLYTIRLFSGPPLSMNARANDRCLALMREEFKPFVTVSCIGVLDGSGKVIAPCMLCYQKTSDTEYAIILSHASPYGQKLLFEINLHEDKLFQDTTVESLHPELNNAFGGTAFIGNTAAYGEQWLYSRPDFSKLPELYGKQIRRAVFHLPRHGGSSGLSALGLTARFCSFGSNWGNKVKAAENVTEASASASYQSLDITNLIIDRNGFLKPSEGFILKSREKKGGFSAVSTGDSFFAPQILEVSFR